MTATRKNAITGTILAAAFAASISGAAIAAERKQDESGGSPPPSDVVAPADNGSGDGRPTFGEDGWLYGNARNAVMPSGTDRLTPKGFTYTQIKAE